MRCTQTPTYGTQTPLTPGPRVYKQPIQMPSTLKNSDIFAQVVHLLGHVERKRLHRQPFFPNSSYLKLFHSTTSLIYKTNKVLISTLVQKLKSAVKTSST